MTVLSIAALLAAGTVSSVSAGELGKLVVTFFEMPQHGIAIAVQTPTRHVYLVDTGIAGDGHDTGRDILAPFLRARKVAEIEGIVHTHPHLLQELGRKLLDTRHDTLASCVVRFLPKH